MIGRCNMRCIGSRIAVSRVVATRWLSRTTGGGCEGLLLFSLGVLYGNSIGFGRLAGYSSQRYEVGGSSKDRGSVKSIYGVGNGSLDRLSISHVKAIELGVGISELCGILSAR